MLPVLPSPPDLSAHNRLVLKAMGIDLWVMRDSKVCSTATNIWRDQTLSTGEPMQEHPVDATIPPEAVTQLIDLQFRLEVMVLPHCAIVVNIWGLMMEDLELWEKIRGAAEHSHLSLEFPVPMFLDRSSKAIHSYIQGFLSQFNRERRVICLGQIPVINMDAAGITAIPALPEFHQNAALKKKLWATIKG